jgi:hypothetical protein
MSGFAAIGGVSATLQALLADRVEKPPEVTVDPTPIPVHVGIPPEDSDDEVRLNLFLYRISENPFLKNQEIPGRGQGNGYGHPPLSLNLHYLLTAYGRVGSGGVTTGTPVDERIAHYLLGNAMRILHDFPVITENLLLDSGAPALHTSLRGEYEKVKLTLDPISLEDVSKVWTALDRPYRLSAAYEVSVVQIESTNPNRHPRRVGEPPPAGPRVRAVSGRRPLIREIVGEPLSGPYARIGDQLRIRGANLTGDDLSVTLGDTDVTAGLIGGGEDELSLIIPDDPGLQPGVLPVRIRARVDIGDPPQRRVAFRSNAGAFVLVPSLESVTPATVTATPRRITLEGSRLFDPNSESVTLIGDTIEIPSDDYLDPPGGDQSPRSFRVEIPDEAPAGAYAVRVRVNDAESLEPREVQVT